MAILFATLVLMFPTYLWGTHVNREVEINQSHIIYSQIYQPRRNRLTHSMIFEEFEMHVEQWKELMKENY